PFATAPIPFDQTLLLDALAARPERQPDGPLTAVYLGDARQEKGYQYLPQALAGLWRDYVATGRVRFVLQSNFNTPGGEPGILTAAQNLAGFPATTLKTKALTPPEYYGILAEADLVLIPYSPQCYRYRSSGVLVEAMGAGKVVVTSDQSWMATQVARDHAVLFDEPAGIGPAIAAAIDRFDALSAAAQARRHETLANATGEALVRHMLASEPAPAGRVRRTPMPSHRVLLVMNGDAMVLQNGASRIMQAQMQYLVAAGCNVVGVFLTYDRHESADAFAAWHAALAKAVAPYAFERAFTAGTGHHQFTRRPVPGSSLHEDFAHAATFEFTGDLLQFLRAHPVDAVLLNYITNYPVVDALGLDIVPVVCEMHDLQAFQRAIYGQRLVDGADLDEEFRWLSRCTALISLNPRETGITRERLPDMSVETTGVLLPPPRPVLASLAGARDVAEIVSSSGPVLRQYQIEAATLAGDTGEIERLRRTNGIDLLFVSSAHMANASGLRWFLSQVYEPHLAPRGVSLVVAGSICRIEKWPDLPLVFYVDQVADLAPLYAAAQIVVLPITEGAGSPVKTIEAFRYGRPVVGTSHAFRGLAADDVAGIAVQEDPRGFVDAVLALLGSADERRRAVEHSCRAADRLNDVAHYFTIMDRVFATALGRPMPATEPPTPMEDDSSGAEWSPSLQAINRIVRAYLEGWPFEAQALDRIANDTGARRLIDGACASLFEKRDAAILKTEHRLKARIATLGRRWSRDDFVFVLDLALASRGSMPAPAADAGEKLRFVAAGGLPLTLAKAPSGAAGSNASVTIDGRMLAVRSRPSVTSLDADLAIGEAEVAAGNTGLRLFAIDAGDLSRSAIVIRQSLPLSAATKILGRNALGDGFIVRHDGAAELPPGTGATLVMPHITDGDHDSIIDLVFANPETDWRAALPARPAVTIDGATVETECLRIGNLLLLRLYLPAQRVSGDFGVVSLNISTGDNEPAPVRLIAASTALLAQSMTEAARVATMLTLGSCRRGLPDQPALGEIVRTIVAEVAERRSLGEATVAALCALALDQRGREILKAEALQHTSIAVRPPEAILDDIDAIVGACLGTADRASAVLHPALPYEIVDEAGQVLPAETTPTKTTPTNGSHVKSWRAAMPSPDRRLSIRITLDAALGIPEHPGLIYSDGFYPTEGPDNRFRWTGPAETATITLPLALTQPARLVIELAATGNNRSANDYTISCNGRVLGHRLTIAEHSATLAADLPAARLGGLSTRIALTVKERFNPDPPDRRTLGVVFRSLSLFLRADIDAATASAKAGSGRRLAAARSRSLPE
ncbi:MAG TPA: glycosyltransferase, partial [Stellaceae bacterium]|nr:glycosyltransferase [Stellaceae bacterium]